MSKVKMNFERLHRYLSTVLSFGPALRYQIPTGNQLLLLISVRSSRSCSFFTRVDRVLRRSLGVSEEAPTDTTVKPAPPVDPELPSEQPEEEEDDGKAKVIVPDHLKDDVCTGLACSSLD